MIAFDFTITLGNVIETGVLLVGGLTYVLRTGGDIRVMKNDMRYLNEQVKVLNTAFSGLSSVLTKLAVQEERLSALQSQINDLRYGRGYVLPNGHAPNGA